MTNAANVNTILLSYMYLLFTDTFRSTKDLPTDILLSFSLSSLKTRVPCSIVSTYSRHLFAYISAS